MHNNSELLHPPPPPAIITPLSSQEISAENKVSKEISHHQDTPSTITISNVQFLDEEKPMTSDPAKKVTKLHNQHTNAANIFSISPSI